MQFVVISQNNWLLLMLHFRVQGLRILPLQVLPKVFFRLKHFQLLLHVQVLPKVLLRMELFSLLLHIQVLPQVLLCINLYLLSTVLPLFLKLQKDQQTKIITVWWISEMVWIVGFFLLGYFLLIFNFLTVTNDHMIVINIFLHRQHNRYCGSRTSNRYSRSWLICTSCYPLVSTIISVLDMLKWK